MFHDLEGQDGVIDAAGDDVAAEDGSEGGEGEQSLRFHGFDGVPHGVEKGILAEEIDDEIPGVGAVFVVELVTGPAEEFDGGSREGVGEFEDLFDVVLRDADAGVKESIVDGVGLDGSDDFAEEFDFWREVRGV